MAVSTVLATPIAPNEQIWHIFDLGNQLSSGEIITSALLTCTDQAGVDTNPSARLLRGTFDGVVSPSICPSPSTGGASLAVCQLIGGCVVGAEYRIELLVGTNTIETRAFDVYRACAVS